MYLSRVDSNIKISVEEVIYFYYNTSNYIKSNYILLSN